MNIWIHKILFAAIFLLFSHAFCFRQEIKNTQNIYEITEIKENYSGQVKIFFSDFQIMGMSENENSEFFEQLQEILPNAVQDLKNCGMFEVIDVNDTANVDYLQSIKFNSKDFNWQILQDDEIDFITQGFIEYDVKKQSTAIVWKIWSVADQENIQKKVVNIENENFLSLAHQMSNDIYGNFFTGAKIFNSDILLLEANNVQEQNIDEEESDIQAQNSNEEESDKTMQNTQRLVLIDQNGQNKRILSEFQENLSMPQISRDNQKMIFLHFNAENNQTKVIVKNIASGEEFVLGGFQKMAYRPTFSPDGNQVIYAVMHENSSYYDIYLYDLQNFNNQKIIPKLSLNSSPSFSPDGKKIVFSATQNNLDDLYIYNLSSDKMKKITANGGYQNAIWSKNSNLIGFVKNSNENLVLGNIESNGLDEKIIARDLNNDNFSWSDNDNYLIFSQKHKNDRSAMQIANLLNGFKRKLLDDMKVSDVLWLNNWKN